MKGLIKGIKIQCSILISAANRTQRINPLFGEILTQDKRFYEYNLDFSSKGDKLIECLEWEEITSKKNLKVSNKGVPKTNDRIALEVLRELNGTHN